MADDAPILFEVTLDCPPSVNEMYAQNPRTNRRHLTAKAKQWKKDSGRIIPSFKWRFKNQYPLKGPLKIRRHFYFKNPNRDYENYFKALTDSLVSAGVIWDDRSNVIVENHDKCTIIPTIENHVVVVTLERPS